MKELLEFILNSLVGKDNYTIEVVEENGAITFIIKSNPEFMGRIIGKGGGVIKAISDVVRIKAKLEGKTVFINAQEN